MAESSLSPALRKRIAGLVPATPPSRFTLGAERLDAVLGGGLARARMHEIWPAQEADQASAAGFALMLAVRAAGPEGTIFWIADEAGQRHTGPIHPPGLAELGADPGRFLFVTVPDEKALVRIAGDVVRSPAAGTAVIAAGGPARVLDLTASRRLTLFAERSGVTAILLRTRDPQAPSAAATRWQVSTAPSIPLEADAPGHPAFAVDLVRQRAGAPSPGWQLEWRRDAATFTSLPRSVPAAAGGGFVASA